ncbi:hypothetical protein HPB49_022584 [Dermacentor silvarum]|uniref:Uncharacterized protein n=1 Tax=Dermacentor silvarum TaxID=543639 RepID=A0ACB8D098_DERSI|nr:hypothetical protein HPB49_022584 [Dermacentor silvarum]
MAYKIQRPAEARRPKLNAPPSLPFPLPEPCNPGAHRGWALKEEEYVKNIRLNLDTTDPNMGVVRATCSPSMKSGVYVVSAWFEKTTGNVVGAHCQCVAG